MAKATTTEPGDVNTPVVDETKTAERLAAVEAWIAEREKSEGVSREEFDKLSTAVDRMTAGEGEDALVTGADLSSYLLREDFDREMQETARRLEERQDGAGFATRESVEELGGALQSVRDGMSELRDATAKVTRDGPHRDISTLPRTEDL